MRSRDRGRKEREGRKEGENKSGGVVQKGPLAVLSLSPSLSGLCENSEKLDIRKLERKTRFCVGFFFSLFWS